MSQSNPPKNLQPVLHRYDPQQPVALPEPSGATIPPPASSDAPATAKPAAPAADRPPLDRPSVDRQPVNRPVEIGGPSGPEPTRYGDWERNGRVSDF